MHAVGSGFESCRLHQFFHGSVLEAGLKALSAKQMFVGSNPTRTSKSFTFRPHSTRRLRFENLLVQLGTDSKEAVLEAAKQKIQGVVRTITRDGNGFIKGS